MTKAIDVLADGDCVLAETEIHRNSDSTSDAQIIGLIKDLSNVELKKLGLKRLEHN
jgi:hypothetical protein